MIQITNMPRVVMREQPSTTTTERHPIVADDDDESTKVSGTKQTQINSITSRNGEVVQPQQNRQEQQQNCFRNGTPTTVEVSSSSISVSLEILHTLSSASMPTSIHRSHSPNPDYNGTFSAEAPEPASHIPRRNLTEAFEELYIKPTGSLVNETETPLVKQSNSTTACDTMVANNVISPTGVAELDMVASVTRERQATQVSPNSKDDVVGKLTDKLGFHLHPSLQRDLTDAVIQRVSFYAIIHDINKEATSMAANDDSGFNRPTDEVSEENDPIVVAVQGYPKNRINGTSAMVDVALIDEEQWLLEAIDNRTTEESRAIKACPATFPQAMGERDYENPLTSLSNGSRTQLWKPSRSWWEAKSGKNPWIEPKNHNKRWRYLWPLIHYHKFLAKCIKKLKRNGVDVKTSVSPVAVFLREEVCAVSDHLASVSLFDSDQWMECLDHFHGWTESNETAKKQSRELVSKLKLRPLYEPGDVDSPLLRSQIDEQYLRAMTIARAQLAGNDGSNNEARAKDSMRRRDSHAKSKPSSLLDDSSKTHGVLDARSTPGYKGSTPNVSLQHWHGYVHHPAWWQGGWPYPGYPYADDASVQSALSADTSLSHGYLHGYHPGLPHNSPYYPPMTYHYTHMMHGNHYELGSIPDASVYTSSGMYNYQDVTQGQWMSHPQMEYSKLPETSGVGLATPSRNPVETQDNTNHPVSSEEHFDSQTTPFKYSPTHAAMSPYWAHLQDHATLSMMGLATPQTTSAPATPHLGRGVTAMGSEEGSEYDSKNAVNAQPLLLRQPYYGYGYNPPSPASRFLMTPQEQAHLGYTYAYGSPRRPQSCKKETNSSCEEVNDARNDVSEGGKTTSVNRTLLQPSSKQSRESPNETDEVLINK
ncbi:hypothetical protein IV203_022046 [Nitzschia inconspicua]|uniref:Uncharacterized protein n=1 Tax=Nitzschia inconspicua TaxID=303405 RepID=A0A9K3PE36_9STRA|nr:hypothetical protein IV203_022046 [Nitzschia inconspicua]